MENSEYQLINKMETMDKTSLIRLQLLHPKLRDEAISLFADAECALKGRAKPRVTFSLRTMKEQLAIYNQGRSTPGPIVTNAKPGASYHNWGLAIDFCLILDGTEVSWNTLKDYDGDKVSDWMEVVNIFKAKGWEWGGDWRSLKDYPHLQKNFGHHWSELLALYKGGRVDKDGYVLF
jgi:peptidoglycan L-alanyl-D-glutamate endopeptidase CwlK